MTRLRAALLAISVAASVAGQSPEVRGLAELERALADAGHGYDLAASTGVLSEARLLFRGDPSPGVADLHVRASLQVAELLRIEFEEAGEGAREGRRILGQRIDATAQEALAVLGVQPRSSETARRRADLIATMIRSDFRAQKYRDDFDRAVAQALEQNERNARAWVSKAKPYVFATPEHGGDLAEAVRLLSHALDLEPALESARLLRAEAYERLGDSAAATADWREALARNPRCAPARKRLEKGASG